MSVDKRILVSQVVAELERERETLLAAHRASAEGVTHEENRAEGDKDMRSTEVSYLARGQAKRVSELSEEILRLSALDLRSFSAGDPIALGALVTLEPALWVFMLPGGAGTELALGQRRARVVTPASPLGSALLGAREGDVIEVLRGGKTQEYEITGVE